MPDGEFLERKQELTALVEMPGAGPATLLNAAWEVLGNVLYDRAEVDAQLLPDARPLVQRVADNPQLRERQSDTYFNARIALATWGVFDELSRNEPISDTVRNASCLELGSIISDTTDGTFRLDSLPHFPAQKMCEAMTLALLLRNSEQSGVFAVPAPPYVHKFAGVDQATGTTAFQIHGMSQEQMAPLFVGKFLQERMRNTALHRNVLVLGLGQVIMSAATKVNSIFDESKRQGSIRNGQRWMLNVMARTLSQETRGSIESSPEERLAYYSTHHLKSLIIGFRPYAANDTLQSWSGPEDDRPTSYTTSSWDP